MSKFQATAKSATWASDFLEREVLPALFHRLPLVFPEFGWVKNNSGWIATDKDSVRAKFGKRADRVICNRPYGFYIHGGDAMAWVNYVNGGRKPIPESGEFIEAVKKLADLARVAFPNQGKGWESKQATQEELDQEVQKEHRENMFEAFLELIRQDLPKPPAQTYLVEKRGFQEQDLEGLELGYYSTQAKVLEYLLGRGFKKEDIESSGLLRESWEGRLVGPWRDPAGHIGTFWARDLTGKAEENFKYLYLPTPDKGGWAKRKAELVLLGLDLVLLDKDNKSKSVVIVEGILDAVSLPLKGGSNVAAIGGGGGEMSAAKWSALGKLGIKQAILALDNDQKPDGTWPGREGTLAAIKNSRNVKGCPEVCVLPPEALDDCKDPDELVRKHGVEAFRCLIKDRVIHPYRYLAQDMVRRHKGSTDKLTDLQLSSLMREAMEFAEDAPVNMGWALHQLFWPPICEATGIDGETLQAYRLENQQRKEREHEKKTYQTLLNDSLQLLEDGNLDDAKDQLEEQLEAHKAEKRVRNADPVLNLDEELERLEKHLEQFRDKDFIGLPQVTLPTLDDWTLGLRGLMLLAAAPNVGKTALTLQLGLDVVSNTFDAVFLFVSLEMPRVEMMTRIKSRWAKMDWGSLVFGTHRDRGRGLESTYSDDDKHLLEKADGIMKELGPRIRILDEKNCPAPTLEKVLWHLEDLKTQNNASKAFVLVDYLGCWPIPDGMANKLKTDIECDKWRIEQMKRLRDESNGAAVMVIAEARKASGNAGEQWGGALADVMGSARGSYTPDIVFLTRPMSDQELAILFRYKPKKPNGDNYTGEEKKANLKRWGKVQREYMAHEFGQAYIWLIIAKGRDGVHKGEMPITFFIRQSTFLEGHTPDDYGIDCQPNPDIGGDEGEEY